MLVLFDLDNTMLATDGAGRSAIVDAGRDLFGESFTAHGVAFAGRLDPLIIRDLLVASDIEPTPKRASALRTRYTELLRELASSHTLARALAGVGDLVDALEHDSPADLGVLTGNFEEPGRLKMTSAGFDPDRFPVRVWGDQSPLDPPHRDQLPGVAIEQGPAVLGRRLDPSEVVVIGDTIHDVACARANGCRSIAVATGAFAEDQLRDAGADLVLPDLAETATITAILAAWTCA